MKKLMIALVAICAATVFADEVKSPEAAAPKMVMGPDGQMHPVKKINRAKLEAAIYKRTGGKLKIPGTQKGKVVYVNCQKAADGAILKEHAAFFAKELKIEIETVEGAFDLAKPTISGDASLFIIDDPAMPMSLVAPEAKWAMINVAPLKTSKDVFFKARVKKQLTRGFCFLGGAVSSQYPQALTECVTKAEQLDKYVDEKLPFDIMQRFATYLPGYGVTPYRLQTYKKACEEGWAPQPTNDVQKVIWDQIHQVPTNGLEIKFDPKKGK